MSEAAPPADPISAARPWVPDLVVDQALATALVRALAPELTLTPPTPLGAGWDNTAWVFRDAATAWVFRFPRRAVAVRCMEAELAALPALAAHLPLPVPVPLHRGFMPGPPSAPPTPWPFGGYRLLAGKPLAELDPAADPAAAQAALAHQLGDFLGALHALPLDLAPSLAPDTLGRLDVARRRPITLASLADCGASDARAEALLDDAVGATATHSPRLVISHGDLDARHVLVDDARRATGVIDWGDLMLCDPAVDLGVAFSSFSGPARATFLEAYRARAHSPSETTLTLARFRALATSARILAWALDIDDATLIRYARAAVARVLS